MEEKDIRKNDHKGSKELNDSDKIKRAFFLTTENAGMVPAVTEKT